MIVCTSLIRRRIKQKKVDDVLEKQSGKGFSGMSFELHELNFVQRGQYPEAFLKFVNKEEWFLKMQQKINKLIVKEEQPVKEGREKQKQFWNNMYYFVQDLMKDLRHYYPQTRINGTMNQWIVKPAGLSRGRKIQIFDNYISICSYIGLPGS